MTSLTLTEDELYDLTRKRRPSAQVRALRALGIGHKTRADGTVVVLRNSLQPDTANAKVREFVIDWGA